MPNASDITITPLSPLNHVNALLDKGPDWNYLTGTNNTIFYTFSVASGNEVREDGTTVTGQQAFSISQQVNTRGAMDYISQLTGIVFRETTDGASAHVHLANMNIDGANTVGLCSWRVSYSSSSVTGELVSYKANAYVYMDNAEWAGQNANLSPGGNGYETLLHELGHMLGLKHPHEGNIQLPAGQDNTSQTLLSYDHLGGPYALFNNLDVAALDWLYGRDGLAGALGVNSATGARYLSGSAAADTITGTRFNDTLRGDKGNDMLNGGEGTDTAVFSGNRAAYTFGVMAGDTLLVSGADGSDTLNSIELLQFFDGTFTRAQLGDTSAPAAPNAAVEKNAAGYVSGNAPVVFGVAEAGATVKVFNGNNQVASGQTDASGLFKLPVTGLANGNYVLSTTATDAAGNVSVASTVSFRVDATPPSTPSGAFALSGNQAAFNGLGEAGTMIRLVNGQEVIGETKVDATGKWTLASNPLANGVFNVVVQSVDDAGNSTNAGATLAFSVNSALNLTGSAGNDRLISTPGNNALQGLDGIDTAVYGGARGSYTVAKSSNGYTVSSATDGLDSLQDVERIQFSDAYVAIDIDIDGNGGQAYRLYTAVLARAPDLPGLGFWMNALDKDILDLRGVADYFLKSAEFTDTYGAIEVLTNQSYVTKLYDNVLHRPLDQAGYDFWVVALENGVARADILVAFSESTENQAQVIGTIQNGAEYVPYLG